jgi:1-acyl-sn-glycerol-3-phosphate acyltransferase
MNIGGRALNLVGLWFGFMTFFWAIVVYPVLLSAWLYSLLFDRRRCSAVDWTIHFWAKVTMLCCFTKPRVSGLENLQGIAPTEPLMFIPNHTSFLDIFTLSGFVPRRLKYVSKIEILRVPLIGWAMQMARHIAIRRSDRRSQMQTFKDAVESLRAGNGVVTFAEGTRSPDGALRKFKKGPFKMTSKAECRIVPVSICDMHRWMPPTTALLPIGFPGSAGEIKIHPPVPTKGRDEEEILSDVFGAINGGLPAPQQFKGGGDPPTARRVGRMCG